MASPPTATPLSGRIGSYLNSASSCSSTTTGGHLSFLHSDMSSCNQLNPGKSFAETTVSLVLCGTAGVVLASLPAALAPLLLSNLAVVAALFCYHWIRVHSYKLDPRCVIVMDEANMLSIDLGHSADFGFLSGMPRTPLRKPTTLWEALFFDERQYKMEQLYMRIYTGEYAHAYKREAEEIAAAAAAAAKGKTSPLRVQKTQEDSSSPSRLDLIAQ